MVGHVKTVRGEVLDMGALVQNNPDTVAVTGGGRSMNAQGDLLGAGGNVIKTREDFETELAEAYDANNPQAIKKISIKNPNLQADVSPQSPREEAEAIVEQQIAPKVEAPAEKEAIASMMTEDNGDFDNKSEISLEDAAALAKPSRKKRNTATDVE